MKRGWMAHPIFAGEPFNRALAWEWLVSSAAWVDGPQVKRGQLENSVRGLADVWDWSPSRVQRFLKILQSANMITLTANAERSLISIVNYERYQNPRRANSVDDTEQDTATDTNSGTATDTTVSSSSHSSQTINSGKLMHADTGSDTPIGTASDTAAETHTKEESKETYPALNQKDVRARARDLIAAFNASQEVAFGQARRMFPNAMDLMTAMAWIADADRRGFSGPDLLAIARAVFDAEHAKRALDGRDAPGTLKYFSHRIADRLVEARTPLPAGQARRAVADKRAWLWEDKQAEPITIDGEKVE
jgi:hypothetical protein